MKKYVEIFYEKTRQVQLRFFSLKNISNKSNLVKLLKILSLFELHNTQLVGSAFVEQNSAFFTASKDIDSGIKTTVKKTNKRLFSKYPFYEIDVVFFGKWLVEIINLAIKEDTTVFVIPVDEKDCVSRVEFLMNEKEFSSVTFSIDKYNYDEIITKIKTILD